MSLVAFAGGGGHKGDINHFEFIICPHPREPVVSGLICFISNSQSKCPLGRIQQFGCWAWRTGDSQSLLRFTLEKVRIIQVGWHRCVILAIPEAKTKGWQVQGQLG